MLLFISSEEIWEITYGKHIKGAFKGNKELFQGLYIYDKWEFKEHPVLIFDFNTISHKNSEVLEKGLRKILKRDGENYQLEVKSETLKGMFSELIMSLYQKYKVPVVVLIDEYDKPIIEHLGRGKE